MFGISHTRVFPGRRAQEAFLGPLVRHWWSQWAPGGDHHSCSRLEEAPTPGKKWHRGGLCSNLIDIVAMLHNCSRAVAAEQNLPVKHIYVDLLSEAFTEVFWWEFHKSCPSEPLWSANTLFLGKHLLLWEGTCVPYASIWLMTRQDFCHFWGSSWKKLHKSVQKC